MLSSLKHAAAALALVALAAILTLHRLGAADVCGFNEAVEGVFVQQMVEHGEYLFPLDNGRAPLYKPPLFHWTATALDRLAGAPRVTAFNLRLPSALYAIAGVALTILLAADLFGWPGGLLAGAILCASYQYIEQARLGRVDMTLCFFETLALFGFLWWLAARDAPLCHPEQSRLAAESTDPGFVTSGTGSKGTAAPRSEASERIREPRQDSESAAEQSRRRCDALRYLFALALGLATLAKGPIGALLPAASAALFLIIERRFDALRRLATPGPILLALLTASSWYAACYFAGRHEFLHRQLGSENFGRFLGALGAMRPWYYLKPLLLNSVPFSLIVPIAVFSALRTWWIAKRPAPASTETASGAATLHQPSASAQPTLRAAPTIDPLSSAPATLPAPAAGAQQAPPDRSAINPRAGEPYGRASTEARALAAVRLLAIFWLVTVVVFSLAAYKRRAYLLPLWPASAVLLAWTLAVVPRRLRTPQPLPPLSAVGDGPRAARASARGYSATLNNIIRLTVIAAIAPAIVVNFIYLPRRAILECGGDSFRATAAQINRIVGRDEPLYSYKLGDEPAALLFYLDRDAPPLDGRLGDAPTPGYVIATAAVWRVERDTALDLTPVFESTSGAQRLVLLRHGPALATR